MNNKYDFKDHPEDKAKLPEYRDKWIKNIMRTDPQTDSDKAICIETMRGIYGAANLEAPKREIFCKSPFVGAVSATIGSAIWWLRKNQNKHVSLFGFSLTECDMMDAIAPACAIVIGSYFGVSAPNAVRAAKATSHKDATRDATWTATRAATRDATWTATRGCFPSMLPFAEIVFGMVGRLRRRGFVRLLSRFQNMEPLRDLGGQMLTAKFIKVTKYTRDIEQRLYQCSSGGILPEYVIVSAISYSEETMIFKADKEGNVVDWHDIEAFFGCGHGGALANVGYTVVTETDEVATPSCGEFKCSCGKLNDVGVKSCWWCEAKF